MVKDLRSRMLAAAALPRESLTVTLEDGERVEVDICGLSQGARGRVMESCLKTTTNDDGEPTTITDQTLLSPLLVALCTYHKGTSERVFEDTDLGLIRGLSAAFFDPIVLVASRISGLNASSKEESKGNSDGTTAGTSPSSSPES